MKIINIVPGFGGTFYCGNCLRDSGFTRAMKETGHEAHTLPIYLPLFAEYRDNEEDVPVFYGAVNIYLKQNFKFLRKMPAWLQNFFNSRPILNYAVKKAGSTRARGLEEMTRSMLLGHEGYQKEELQQLLDYLKFHEKPDIVHLSNALLLGLAYKIRNELNIPVVCSLQDEDVWIDAMEDSYRKKLWNLMAEKARDVDAFVAVSDYFAGVMKMKMSLNDKQLHTIHVGVDPEKYEVTTPAGNSPVIGFLSRMNKGNGFEILIDAFIELKDNLKFKDAKLRLSGGRSGDDKRFINRQIRKLKKKDYLKDVEFIDDFRTDALPEFFRNMSLLSVPVLKGEAFGLYQLEALASGVPIVQPALGAFPEIIEATKGGVVYQPNTARALSEKWLEVLSDPDNLKQMGLIGRKAVVDNFNTRNLTKNMIKVYQHIKTNHR
ncbi:MAG: glycosyltransferase family 4 protein [Bacteroidales bacterium]|nr:glycosyltransferase family 4 protein [Bacteroidales bacterium]